MSDQRSKLARTLPVKGLAPTALAVCSTATREGLGTVAGKQPQSFGVGLVADQRGLLADS